ncbi:hypothetical protein PO181_01060 [Leuconostoc suionicum]|uniref:hypothetical protein n=1 Tax=Leuconostoc suionicum TaxID=1511761 RepID=UPI00233EB5EE|nr:hypothetical protein [Leuconostoc suionicum]MDC2815590.1 hypothetical protein [Leuconostoc suionicum]
MINNQNAVKSGPACVVNEFIFPNSLTNKSVETDPRFVPINRVELANVSDPFGAIIQTSEKI